MYPSPALLSSFLTDMPRDVVIALVFILFGTFLLFLSYDEANRRLANRLVVAAATEAAKADLEYELQCSRQVFVSMARGRGLMR